jgi:ubiquinone/menaquinone biosynthesis C-methylase UbiE
MSNETDYDYHFEEHREIWERLPTLHSTQNEDGYSERKSFIVSNVKGNVLDAGTNDGTFIEAVRRKGHRTVGIDIVPSNIAKAKRLYPENEFHVMDTECLKFEDESFDTVVLTETIEHLVNPDKALQEVQRVLRKDGTFLCTTTYIKDEPTHYQCYEDLGVFLELIERYFHIETVNIGYAGCYQVIGGNHRSKRC